MKPLAAAVLLALSAASPAFATTTIDFDAVTSFESIADFYNGGTDSAGATGESLGISFGGDAIAVANDTANFPAYYLNAPSPLAVMTPVGADSALNAAAGLTGSVSFYYSAVSSVTNGVQVWSGLNGTGSLLASFDLVANDPAGGCNDGKTDYCNFALVSGSFTGTAESVTFGNATGVAAFDNVTVAVIPEPATYAMMAAGLAGLALTVRRRRG